MGDRKRQRQLLGYLLGALDDRQQRRIDEQLIKSPELQAELARVEEDLEPLRRMSRWHQPPLGLAARTCSMVFAFSEALAARKSAPRSPRVPVRRRARSMSPTAVPPSSTATWGWSDLLVAVSVFLAIAGLIFPAIQNSRMNMRMVACQNNLREIGVANAQFQQSHPPAFVDPAMAQPPLSAPVSLASLIEARDSTGPAMGSVARPSRIAPRAIPVVPASFSPGMVSPHQGFSQRVHGQNVLFVDGHVIFLAMAPIDFSSASPETQLAADSPRLTDDVPPGAPSNSMMPIMLVNQPTW